MTNTNDESWVKAAQSELFDGWQRWASFACIWIWSCLAGILAQNSAAIQVLPGILSNPNEVVLIASVAGLLCVLPFSKKISTIVASRRVMLASGALLTAGSICLAWGALAQNAALFVIGAAAGGAMLAPLKIAWGEMYSLMQLRRGLISMGYSLIASMTIVLIVAGLAREYQALTLVIVALPCAHLVFVGTKRIIPSAKTDENNAGSVRFSASLLLLPAMVALSYGVVKAMMPWFGESDGAVIMASGSYAELFGGILLLAFAYNLGKRIGPAQVYSVALIFVVAGLVSLSSQSVPPWVSYFLNDLGFTLFYFFMVVYWGDLSRRTGLSVVRVYAIGYLSFQAMNMVGSFLGYYVSDTQSTNQGVLLVLSIVMVLFVVALLLFGNSRSSLRQWLIADAPAIEQGDEIPQACAEITQLFSLSAREQEVLGLLARGRNASYIARILYIAPDTAKTHIKNIYRKLDIHTQQDLLDLIDNNQRS